MAHCEMLKFQCDVGSALKPVEKSALTAFEFVTCLQLGLPKL